MNKKRWALLLIFALLVGTFAGCGKTQEGSKAGAESSTAESVDSQDSSEKTTSSELPISENPIELTFARVSYPGIRPQAEEIWIWEDFTEKSNMKINWDEYPITTAAETLNLKLSTGDLPDAFYQIGVGVNKISELGDAGQFLALDDMIEQHAPNLKQLYINHPEYKKLVTMPDGNMYSLPYVQQDPHYSTVRWYIHQPTLDALGMELPKTVEEFDTYLRGAKELDPENYPFWMPGEGGVLFQTMMGAYGLGTTGIQGVGMWLDLDENGELRFINSSQRYKEMLEQFAIWYQDGIIHPEMFAKLELAKWQNEGTNGNIAAFAWVVPDYVGNSVSADYVGVSQLEGPHGDNKMSWADSRARGASSFIITANNPYPVETMKWADYWYGEEGYMYGAIGTEDVTYHKEGDKYIWSDDIQAKVDELGRQVGPFQFLETWYGAWEPQVYGMEVSKENNQKLYDLEYFTPPEQTFRIDGDDVYKFLPETIWTLFIPTVDESNELSEITPDITTYLGEMQAKFVTGNASLETEWDTFIENLESMGLSRYMEIRKTQYERYRNS